VIAAFPFAAEHALMSISATAAEVSARTVHVSGLSGPLCSILVEAEGRLAGLKAAIQEATDICGHSQRLIHGLNELRAEDSLGDLFDQLGTDVDSVDILLVRRSEEQVQWLQELEKLSCFSVDDWLRDAPEGARSDRELMLSVVGKVPYALQHASLELRNDRDFMLAAVTVDGASLEYATPEFKSDLEIALLAVVRDGFALRHVSPELKTNRQVVLTAVMQEGGALQFAAPELRADHEVVLAAVCHNALTLRFAAPELIADRSIVLAAVRQNGVALKFAAPELRADKVIATEAVDQCGLALQFLPPELKNDPEVVRAYVVKKRRLLEQAVSLP